MPTIAHQLAQYSPSFWSALRRALIANPEVGGQNIVLQFKELLQQPLSEVKTEIFEGIVVVVDALDECGNKDIVRLMLEMLLRFAPDLSLKFFVTSRSKLVDKVTSPAGIRPAWMHLDDIEWQSIEDDIKKYLAEVLSPMRPPPKERQIDQLARNSGKSFIYAATAAHYVYPGNILVDSAARLKAILTTNSERPKGALSNQYKELDQLYATVLTAAFGETLENESENMRRVLWTTVCAREPMATKTLSSILSLTEQEVSLGLQPLQSMLRMSEGDEIVSILHTPFPEYLLDQSRSGSEKFHCNEPEHNEFLARCCFEVMKKDLRFNICNLESSFVLDKRVPYLNKRVEEAIPPSLFYACRYWSEHLQRTPATPVALSTMLAEFLSWRLLFWMEVLNLRKCIGVGIGMLLQAQNWLSVSWTCNFIDTSTKMS